MLKSLTVALATLLLSASIILAQYPLVASAAADTHAEPEIETKGTILHPAETQPQQRIVETLPPRTLEEEVMGARITEGRERTTGSKFCDRLQPGGIVSGPEPNC